MKKFFALLLAVVVIAAAAWWAYPKCVVKIGDQRYLRWTKTLDLSGMHLDDPDIVLEFPRLEWLDLQGCGVPADHLMALETVLPDCQILWDTEFHGILLPQDTQSISVDHLTDDDVIFLDCLKYLTSVNAQGCRDYEQLEALKERRPNVTVRYTVPIGEKEIPMDAFLISLKNADLMEVMEQLSLLPTVKRVRFQGMMQNPAVFPRLAEAFPHVIFTWGADTDIMLLDEKTDYLNFDDLDLTQEEAEMLMHCFPALKEATFLNSSLSAKELMQLTKAFPHCKMLYNLPILGTSYQSDVTEIDLSGKTVRNVAEIEARLPYFPNLKTLIMCDCGIENEEMDALNRRWPDIRILWNVIIADRTFRTDAKVFAPVTFKRNVTDRDLENLQYLTEAECVDLGHMKITHCRWAENMMELKYLVLADTLVQDISPLANHKKLVFLELFLTGAHYSEPLKTCTALEDLNYCYTDVYDPENIAEMDWLKRLWWSGPNWKGKIATEGKLPNTQIEWDSPQSTGNGWRKGQRYFEMRDMMGMYYMD